MKRTMKTWIVVLLAALTALPACSQTEDSVDAEVPLDGENEVFAASGKFDANGVEEHSWEAACVLSFANKGTLAQLDDDARLWRIAAEGIVEWRAGSDTIEGTDDDRVYSNLDELDDIRWIGWIAFGRMSDFAAENGFCPQLAEETIPPGEAPAVQAVIDMSVNHVHKSYAEGERPSRRDAHP
ncbi:MAG: hypothetical protein ACI9WU_004310, partial [Myxococcota bacterium]